MSTHNFAVSDKGLAVKLEEININEFCKYVKQHDNIALEPNDGETMLDVIREFLIEDAQWFMGTTWDNGVICHKWSYGNDIYGDFIPIIHDVKNIEVDVENDDWVMMCLPRYASLFEQAYANEEALIEEMKLIYGNFLPENFNYRERLGSLCAVVWG